MQDNNSLQDNWATFDATDGFLIINWATDASAHHFIQVITTAAELGHNPEVVLQVGIDPIREATYEEVAQHIVLNPDVESEINLIRVNLTETCSVAWERLPSTGPAVGYGSAWQEMTGLLSDKSLFSRLLQETCRVLPAGTIGPTLEKFAVEFGNAQAFDGPPSPRVSRLRRPMAPSDPDRLETESETLGDCVEG